MNFGALVYLFVYLNRKSLKIKVYCGESGTRALIADIVVQPCPLNAMGIVPHDIGQSCEGKGSYVPRKADQRTKGNGICVRSCIPSVGTYRGEEAELYPRGLLPSRLGVS